MSEATHAEPTITLELTRVDEIVVRAAKTLLEQEPREMIFIDEATGDVIPLGTRLVTAHKADLQEFTTSLERMGAEYYGITPEEFRAVAAEADARWQQMRREEQPFIDAVQRRMEQIGPAFEAAFEAAAAYGAFEADNK